MLQALPAARRIRAGRHNCRGPQKPPRPEESAELGLAEEQLLQMEAVGVTLVALLPPRATKVTPTRRCSVSERTVGVGGGIFLGLGAARCRFLAFGGLSRLVSRIGIAKAGVGIGFLGDSLLGRRARLRHLRRAALAALGLGFRRLGLLVVRSGLAALVECDRTDLIHLAQALDSSPVAGQIDPIIQAIA